jgi:hypothetical protein
LHTKQQGFEENLFFAPGEEEHIAEEQDDLALQANGNGASVRDTIRRALSER